MSKYGVFSGPYLDTFHAVSKDKDATMTQNNPEGVRTKRSNHKEKKHSTSEDKTNIFILGDSMVKHVEGWKLSKNDVRKQKVYVRNFPSAIVKCMKDYIKHYVRGNNPDHVVIHLGISKLDPKRAPGMIAKSIIDIAKNMEIKTCTVSISGIVPRNSSLNIKTLHVNGELRG